ncbi:unnamed protein product [Ilex paraguariensis]|uniref:Late embryogenesis abundant protein LEA-2 subgroup domain-containing protein n=1 Tax=Ilex paraguariensis TaxID=185542 RepID=A0ABC8SI64_9AQUA
MLVESQVIPLSSAQIHPRSDEEFAMTKPYNTHHQRSSKCFVYTLAAVVFLSMVLLIFASVVLRVDTPNVEIRSAWMENLRYGTSPSPSLNLTLISEVAVDNKNFGRFKLEKSSKASLLHGNETVGDTEINVWGVRARETKRVNATVQVRANGLWASMNFSREIDSGLVKLSSYAKLRGEVLVMKKLKRNKTAIMNCTMILNLTSQAIHNLLCK